MKTLLQPHFDIRFGRFTPEAGVFLLTLNERGDLVIPTDGSMAAPLVRLEKQQSDLLYVAHWQSVALFVSQREAAEGETLLPLRDLAAQDEALFSLCGRARQLLVWRQNHRFCGRCGAENTGMENEQALRCPSCELSHYPRLMPCVMALIVKGDECLLACHKARNQWWTTLAGFVEAGESLEEALYREIREEVDLEIKSHQFFASQAWPFPGQLMVGFYVEVAEGDIRIDEDELESAKWFYRDSLPIVPPSFTLSGQLIEGFASGNMPAGN